MPEHRYDIQMHDRKQYVADCSYLDDQQPMTLDAKIVYGAHFPAPEPDEHSTTLIEATFSRPVTYREAQEAGYDMFARGCSCEHDCCGHWHGGSGDWVQRSRNGKRWSAKLHYARNF